MERHDSPGSRPVPSAPEPDLARAQRELSVVLESLLDHAILTMDGTGRVTSWSAGARAVFGFEEAEMIGRSSDQLWTPEDLAQGRPERERAMARTQDLAEDTRWHVGKAGRRVFVTGSLRPLRIGGGSEEFVKICRDITDQQHAREAVAEADARARAAVETERAQLTEAFRQSPSFMAILRGPEHRFQFVNDRYEELVGHREFVGRTVGEVLPEVVSQGFVELLDEVYRTGRAFAGQDVSVLLRRRGEAMAERIVDFVYQPTREPDGTVTGVFVHGVDVTEKKAVSARAEILASQQKMALDAAHMGLWRLDPRSRTASLDARSAAIYDLPQEGCPLDDLLGRILPADRPAVEAALARATDPAHPQTYAAEYRIRGGDGSTRWISSRGQATRDAMNNIACVVGVVADITEQRAAEEALRESEKRFRQLADAMPQIVFAARPDGHVDYFNRQWYEYTGIAEGEIGYESWRHVHSEEHLPAVVERWTRSVQTGEPYQIEYPLRNAAGEFRWHLGRALPVRDENGDIIRWFGTNTDIDDYKRLQESYRSLLESERAARSEAERTGRIKDEFLATLSHELRTPLNAILGWVQVLRTGASQPADLASGLATIERNARAQTQIIEDLLDMSAIISGKVRLEVQRLDVTSILVAVVETMRPTAAAKGVELAAAFTDDPLPAKGDPNRLQQIFWNLLSNAIKFTPRGGSVGVQSQRRGAHVEVTVSDSGAGIRREFLPHVFDRFRQADASTTRRQGGLGLGLAIVKQLVELHGGTVAAHSDGEGTGAVFTVTLPRVDDARITPLADQDGDEGASTHLPELTALRLDDTTVLVVDDEPDGRAVLSHLLADRGARVLTAESARDALDALTATPVDLLISDIGMPGEDGYSLIRRVRALPADRGGSVPAIALTAYARMQDRTAALLAGFQMHAAKPVEATELLAMVASLTCHGIPRGD